MGSARSNRAASSAWQKYWVRNSSGRQAIWAPRSAAWRSSARAAEVVVRVGRTSHLDQADGKRALVEAHGGFITLTIGQVECTMEHRNDAVKLGRGAAASAS